MSLPEYQLHPIGIIRSPIKRRGEGPKQGREGASDAWLDIDPTFSQGLEGIAVEDEIIVITWLHVARRDESKVHPRGDQHQPMAGVFSTRSPDRPNPLGLHRVRVIDIVGSRLKVGPIEAIDGTPVVDIKPALDDWNDS
jgi:tRNA-Thr(GGU) m(6)t(6)A37 methyltransferase TsaA